MTSASAAVVLSTSAARAPLTLSTDWCTVASAYLDTATDSPESRRAYRRALQRAFTHCRVQTVAQLTGAMLAAYRANITSSKLSPASQSQALAALRSFLAWAGAMGAHRLASDVIRTALRTPRATVRTPYQVLSEPEIADVLQATTTARDKALLAVLLGAGLRAAETVGLDVADVLSDQDGGTALFIRQGKGRKDRTVPVQPEVAHLIRTYLAATGRRLGDSGPLFRAHDRAASKRPRGRLSTRAVGYMVRKTTQVAAIHAKRISPHSLRHTYAIRALRVEGNVVKVAKLLGHASVTTTGRYLDHLALGELRSTVPTLPGAE
jgi:integrase/recombinase XerD